MLRDTQWKAKTNQLQIDRLRTEQREDRANVGLLTNCAQQERVRSASQNAASRLELMPYPE